jgi:hypothetical protein
MWPPAFVETSAVKMLGEAWATFLDDAKECIPGESMMESFERDFLALNVSATEILDTLLGHGCTKITKVVDDALALNQIEQQSIEALLAFDQAPEISTLFTLANKGLVARGELTGVALTRLMTWVDEVNELEGEFGETMNAAFKIVEAIYVPIKCVFDNVDIVLEQEINKLPTSSSLREVLVNQHVGWAAVGKVTENFMNIVESLGTALKDVATVVNGCMTDFYKDGMEIMQKEIYKNVLLSEYVAINTTSMVTLFEANILSSTKAFVGNAFILVGVGVALFATSGNNLPQLPQVELATLNNGEDEVTALLLQSARDLLLDLVAGVAQKLESERKFLFSFSEQLFVRAKQIAAIEHTLQTEVLTLMPQIVKYKAVAVNNFEKSIKLGLNLTFDEVANKLNC